MRIENRKYKRYRAQENAYVALRIDFKRTGKISDISTNGLSFSYLAKNSNNDTHTDPLFADIFLSGNRFHLSHLPCTIAYEISGVGSIKINGAEMHRCGLEFKDLNRHQIEQLNVFIKNHTTDIVV